MTPVAGEQLPTGAEWRRRESPCGHLWPADTSAACIGPTWGLGMSAGAVTWGLGMSAGAGWTAEARDRHGAVRHPGTRDMGTGWDVDSGAGILCKITRMSCVRTRRPCGRPGAIPSVFLGPDWFVTKFYHVKYLAAKSWAKK
jgi:hypothetical protein